MNLPLLLLECFSNVPRGFTSGVSPQLCNHDLYPELRSPGSFLPFCLFLWLLIGPVYFKSRNLSQHTSSSSSSWLRWPPVSIPWLCCTRDSISMSLWKLYSLPLVKLPVVSPRGQACSLLSSVLSPFWPVPASWPPHMTPIVPCLREERRLSPILVKWQEFPWVKRGYHLCNSVSVN